MSARVWVRGRVRVRASAMRWFHYCGGNTNLGEIGLAMRIAGGYVGWVFNAVKKQTESCNLDAAKHGLKKQKHKQPNKQRKRTES